MDMMKNIIIKIGIFLCVALLVCSCEQNVDTEDGKIDTPTPEVTMAELEPAQPTSKPVNEEEASPKLQGDADAPLPTEVDIEAVTKQKVTSVLASDSLVYELPVNENFAVALREDITKGVRWLLASEDGNYRLLEEQHINGYRVFVFSSDIKGETTMVYELESGGLIAETLSYRLFLGVKAK
jgi:predicted secreted protein